MAHAHTVTCDWCKADITEGDGRRFHLALQGVSTPMRPGTLPKVDAHESPPQKHFCSYGCVALWARDRVASIDRRQVAFEATKNQV